MTIHIEELKFQTIIGILDFERTAPQAVVVTAIIDYKYKKKFLNYVEIVDLIKTEMIESKFLLIEDALYSINKKLRDKFKSIKKIDLKITKPSILADCSVSVSNKYRSNS